MYILKRDEGGPGHGGETGVDLVSEKLPSQKPRRWSWAGWRDRC